jgi:hypothetical protein
MLYYGEFECKMFFDTDEPRTNLFYRSDRGILEFLIGAGQETYLILNLFKSASSRKLLNGSYLKLSKFNGA